MDLPPDKAKLLKQYDDEKKWDIICDQVSALYYLWPVAIILSCVDQQIVAQFQFLRYARKRSDKFQKKLMMSLSLDEMLVIPLFTDQFLCVLYMI